MHLTLLKQPSAELIGKLLLVSRYLRNVGGIYISMLPLMKSIEDTTTIVGNETYTAALDVYNYAKNSSNTDGIGAVVDQLSRRFARTNNTPNPSTEAIAAQPQPES